MNNEQLRKEFQAWAIKEGISISIDTVGVCDSMWIQSSFESYQAAAKSRDEFIGKIRAQVKEQADIIQGWIPKDGSVSREIDTDKLESWVGRLNQIAEGRGEWI